MDKVERCHLCLSLFAGAVLGMAIGVAAHWSVGILTFVAWVVIHALTWGFAPANAKHAAHREPDSETFS